MKKNHPFHLVTKSPWPILTSMNILTTMTGMTMWVTKKELTTMMIGMMMTTTCSMLWWRDVTRESTFQGNHTKKVTQGLKLGMILFILSEVMFFVSFFWAFFHSSLSPSIEIGMNWPPKSIKPFNPMEVPLLNTIILLSSGASITWAHQSIMMNNLKKFKKSMIITIILGVYFSILQKWEYSEATFTIADSIYGSTFFVSTGFHGLHVIIGTTFIMVCLMRGIKLHFSANHHLGFEAASWYWHFVDVVWLFLYISVYWWGK
uniref:Cytochrome c oxidase subunit 3 n=1 Tax=Metcalfa pruinosa TaxID=1185500 RepID=A0A8F2Q758_9HEMI|nr:cytochrome c oxidase subunit III [Metcalfa pruinosa]QWV61024.1 cytochrome c oxidase subunit III [Metcalfa pruinosa]WAR47338.1 cytochrome c oxidase subunit III [Metcalfa pruinosa]